MFRVFRDVSINLRSTRGTDTACARDGLGSAERLSVLERFRRADFCGTASRESDSDPAFRGPYLWEPIVAQSVLALRFPTSRIVDHFGVLCSPVRVRHVVLRSERSGAASKGSHGTSRPIRTWGRRPPAALSTATMERRAAVDRNRCAFRPRARAGF